MTVLAFNTHDRRGQCAWTFGLAPGSIALQQGCLVTGGKQFYVLLAPPESWLLPPLAFQVLTMCHALKYILTM